MLQLIFNCKKELLSITIAHLSLVLLFYLVGYCEIKPESIDLRGYSAFSSDSFACHDQALQLKTLLENEEFSEWWEFRSRFHTRVASVAYFVWGKLTGYNILALWPINCLLLLMSWTAWKYLIFQLGGRLSSKLLVWLAFPILLVHFTQLLRDPYYIAFFLMWLNAWIFLFKTSDDKSYYKAFIVILLISPFLYWVRDRFWILAQLMSVFCFGFGICLFIAKKKNFLFIKILMLLFLSLNSYSIYKMVMRVIAPEQMQSEKVGIAVDKPFVFFYKVAFLRKNFIKSYDQVSGLDKHIQFNSDADVIAYIPRAIQIGLFMPFPNMWFEYEGKTGVLGKLLSAWEMVLMWFVMALVFYKLIVNKVNVETTLCLVIILISTLALGLVVTNGGALYRMRLSSWLVWGALCYALCFPALAQNNGIKLEVPNKKTGE